MPLFGRVRTILKQSPRWLIGAAFATPALGFMQGVALLIDYRKYYGDFPYPASPSRGLVVSVDERNQETKKHSKTHFLRFRENNPPLRLLVIGDSLAAGVGVIHRATPVLPESIARTLSQNLGGRPVFWTCIGRPGAVLQEIIHHIETHDKNLKNLSVTGDAPVVPPTFKGRLLHRMHCIDEWWQDCSKRRTFSLSENEGNATDSESPMTTMWTLLREDIRLFWKACRTPMDNGNDSLHTDGEKDGIGVDELVNKDESQLSTYSKQRLHRREVRWGEDSVGDYDIAVVLTGSNDLKHAWLPFMFNDNEETDGKSLPEMLQRLVVTLRSRMKPMLSNGQSQDATSSETGQSRPGSVNDNIATQKPLVVFPATPITLVPQLHSFPLRWFIFAAFNRLEKAKKELAEKFPGGIVFVESPPTNIFSEIQAGEGKIYEDLKAEAVLLKLTNVTRRVQENFEKKAKEYREKWIQLMSEQGAQSEEVHDFSSYSSHPDESYPDYEISKSNKLSRILSLDQLHPSDEGYEIWGRHIAGEVLKQWKPT